ncbi:hypothetical protein J1614_012087 [Plenodomus biglobosus]|nr:hypothetical protein J1614_012087 [Plenodomus biglobosus]
MGEALSKLFVAKDGWSARDRIKPTGTVATMDSASNGDGLDGQEVDSGQRQLQSNVDLFEPARRHSPLLNGRAGSPKISADAIMRHFVWPVAPGASGYPGKLQPSSRLACAWWQTDRHKRKRKRHATYVRRRGSAVVNRVQRVRGAVRDAG